MDSSRKRLFFGTDGIRGRVGKKPITPEDMLHLGWAMGKVLTKHAGCEVLIGKDTRESGYMIESALESGLSAAGMDVALTGPLPTPAVARLTRASNAVAGIMISASHNPYHDNGVKIFTSNGAAYEIGPQLLEKLGADVVLAGVVPDGYNINHECGSVHPQHMIDLVIEHNADLGISLDGDADRVLLADARGNVVDGDGILYVLAVYGKTSAGLMEGIVGTVMTNFGLELACRRHGIAFDRSNVGDRYVLEKMYAKNWKLGGETSGHIIQLDKSTTGDGLLTAISVLEVMHSTGQTLAELVSGLEVYPQRTANIPINGFVSATRLLDDEAVVSAVREAESVLDCNGRVVLRPSGTEPVIRVMVEGIDAEQVEMLVQQLTRAVESSSAKY